MTKSDDFFDITGAAERPEAPADSPAEVDFDVFGNAEPPAPEIDLAGEFTETLVVRKPAPAAPATDDDDFDLEPAPPRPSTPAPARTQPLDVAPVAAPGSAKWWIGAVIAVVVAAAAWFLTR